MGTFQADPAENIHFQVVCKPQAFSFRLMACTSSCSRSKVVSNLLFFLFNVEEGLAILNNQSRRAHRDQFPLSDHLFSLMTIVQADLTEQRRERLTVHLALRGIALQSYKFDLIRSVLFYNSSVLHVPLEKPFFSPNQSAENLVMCNMTVIWTAVQVVGQLQKRLDRKALCNNLRTFPLSMMKPQTLGLPDSLRADGN